MNAWEREEEDAPVPAEEDLAKLAKLFGCTNAELRYGALWEIGSPMVREPGAAYVTSDALPRELQAMARRFEAEALEADASPDEMAYIRQALESPATVRMFARGHVEHATATPDQLRADYEGHIAMLRAWLRMQLKRRQPSK